MKARLSVTKRKLVTAARNAIAKTSFWSNQIRTSLLSYKQWARNTVVAIRTGVHPKVVQIIDQRSSSIQTMLQNKVDENFAAVSKRLDLDRGDIEKLSTRTIQLELRLNQIPEEMRSLIKGATSFKHYVVSLCSTEFELNPGKRDTIALPFVHTAGLINPKIVAELAVVGGANNDVTLYLSDNYGRTKDNFGQTGSGRFEMPISTNGTYSLHLDNTMSWVSRKFGSLQVSLEYETIIGIA